MPPPAMLRTRTSRAIPGGPCPACTTHATRCNKIADVSDLLGRRGPRRLPVELIGIARGIHIRRQNSATPAARPATPQKKHSPSTQDLFMRLAPSRFGCIFRYWGDRMTHKLTLLIALPAVAGMVTACGGGGGRSQAPHPVKLAAAPTPKPKTVPVHLPGGSSSATYYQDDNSAVLSLRTTAAGRLHYSEYGLAVVDRGTSTIVGGFGAGVGTPKSQMPTSASATYKGSFGGIGGLDGPYAEGLVEDAQLTANFGSGKVNGRVSNLKNTDGVSKSYGLSMNGQISGNTYSGSAGFTDKSGARSGRVTDSALSGAFYGPNAVETAGALGVKGTPGAGQAPTTIVGAFGAKKQ